MKRQKYLKPGRVQQAQAVPATATIDQECICCLLCMCVSAPRTRTRTQNEAQTGKTLRRYSPNQPQERPNHPQQTQIEVRSLFSLAARSPRRLWRRSPTVAIPSRGETGATEQSCTYKTVVVPCIVEDFSFQRKKNETATIRKTPRIVRKVCLDHTHVHIPNTYIG